MPASSPALVSVNVDGRELALPAGMNLLEALEGAGIKIPHFCFHEKLSIAGSCGMCRVEVGMPPRTSPKAAVDADGGEKKINWKPEPVSACKTTVAAGLHVRVASPLVNRKREEVLKALLTAHSPNCPICDKAGECRLQEYTFESGLDASIPIKAKDAAPRRVRIGARVLYDAGRCILCSRCIRFCREVAKDAALEFAGSGAQQHVACVEGQTLDGNYSLNTVDLCPTGALAAVDFRFKMRVWFLKRTLSICPESSVGVNTTVWSRDGKIYRITPRRNDAVNDSWMPDSGRERFKRLADPHRMTDYLHGGVATNADGALDAAAEILRTHAGALAYVVSGRLSVEEQAMLREVIQAAPGRVWLPAHTDANDGLLLSEDRTPNARGALLVGLVDHAPTATLDDLPDAIARGEIRALATFREDITTLGVSAELIKKHGLKIICLTTHANDLTVYADVVFPALTVLEKDGSFVNQQFRLQKFRCAVPAPSGIVPEIALLRRLATRLAAKDAANGATAANTETAAVETVDSVWARLGAATTGAFAGLNFAKIPDDGLPLDSTPWKHLKFSETGSLHYAPDSRPRKPDSKLHGQVD